MEFLICRIYFLEGRHGSTTIDMGQFF